MKEKQALTKNRGARVRPDQDPGPERHLPAVADSFFPSVQIPPDELIHDFLSGRSESTIAAYRQDLAAFQDFVGADSADETAALFLGQSQGHANKLALAFKARLLEWGMSPSTINRRLAALRSLVKFARSLGLVPWSLQVSGVNSRSYRDTSGPGVPAVAKLLKAAATLKSPRRERDTAIVRLFFDLALRRGEIVSLDIEHLDLPFNRLWVLGKGKRERELLSMPDATAAALHAWISVRGNGGGALFTNLVRDEGKRARLSGRGLYAVIRDLGKRAGIVVHPHGLRHTSITEAVKRAQGAGIGLDEVRQFSRHKDVKTLMIYRDQDRNVQGALAGLVSAAPDE